MTAKDSTAQKFALSPGTLLNRVWALPILSQALKKTAGSCLLVRRVNYWLWNHARIVSAAHRTLPLEPGLRITIDPRSTSALRRGLHSRRLKAMFVRQTHIRSMIPHPMNLVGRRRTANRREPAVFLPTPAKDWKCPTRLRRVPGLRANF